VWEESVDYHLTISEIFNHRYGPVETYTTVLENNNREGGLSYKEIAALRGISYLTVKRHLDIAVQVGVAVREENGSITMRARDRDYFRSLVPPGRLKFLDMVPEQDGAWMLDPIYDDGIMEA
jgi:predicted ArsR family transcriptional regulator